MKNLSWDGGTYDDAGFATIETDDKKLILQLRTFQDFQALTQMFDNAEAIAFRKGREYVLNKIKELVE